MAGYSGHSMSNNAVEAYSNGELPLSKAAPAVCKMVKNAGYKVTVSQCRAIIKADGVYTQHHTSKMYNYTKFYAVEEAAELVIGKLDAAKIELQMPGWSEMVTAVLFESNERYWRGEISLAAHCARAEAMYAELAQKTGMTAEQVKNAYYA
jgi:hypothetical protein